MPNPARIAATLGAILDGSPGPVRVHALLHSGLKRGQVRAAVAAGELKVLRRGVVMPSCRWDLGSNRDRTLWAAAAAMMAFPGSFSSHATAARIHGLPEYRLGSGEYDGVPFTHITRLGAARQDGWLRVHGVDTPPERVVTLQGLASTDLIRTSIEVAATRSPATAVVYLDAALRLAAAMEYGDARVRKALAQPEVSASLKKRWSDCVLPYARHRWVTRVRDALLFADPAAESVLESLSRVAIHDCGIPAPRCGVPLVGDDGRTYWVDMYWDKQRIIGEADGALKYNDPSAVVFEKRRQEALEGRGYRFVRWGWPEVVPQSEVMARRIRRAFVAHPPTRSEWL